MADSTLSLTYTSLLDAVCYFLYGEAYADCDTGEKAKADEVVNNGYRQFVYPPVVDGVPPGYEWSFLRPTTTLDTTADDADQDMPDDFGRLIDGFAYEEDAQRPGVVADVGEGKIRRLRQQMSETGKPRVAGLRKKALPDPATSGQRQEIMWYPTPDATYTLSYRYEVLVDKLTDASPYPVGSMKHAETLRLSVLAMADAMINDNVGIHHDNFLRALVASVARDTKEGAKFFGNVGCHGEYESDNGEETYNYTLSVGGVQLYP